ncbi:hypothetical protein [Geodermatophilus chilensis]|uniref:hypothetical protein n=1 Tax=Geodermatophilus chilensis TaxID=2035835 RepID=UPI000C25EFF8|nr:hypothetical protein [Geodermatophilus chilensis]
MVRGIVIGLCSTLFLVVTATGALACDTSSWLQVRGTAAPGAAVTVYGGGLEPGPMTLVWDRSGGEVVGAASVSPDGRVEADVEIPATAAGRHTIIAVPAAAAESPVDLHAWTDVIVPGGAVEPQPVPVPVPAGRATAESSLAGQVGLGLAALTIAVLVLAVRRRRAAGRAAAAGIGGVDALDAELRGLLDEQQRDPSSATGTPGSPVSR